jgi:hypothetical protein
MTDNFINDFRSERDFDDEPGDDLPDWIEGTSPDEADLFDDADEFDHLRAKSARSGSTYDEMDMDDGSNEGLSLSHLTPPQRVILAVLLLLDVAVIVVGVLLITGRI